MSPEMHAKIRTQIDSQARIVGSGWIEVITGSMFSGKTEELIRRMRRAQIAKQSCLLVKPALDTRYSTDHVVSHNQDRFPSISLKRIQDLFEVVGKHQVVGIDEAQFFDQNLPEVCGRLADEGIRVIVAGLDQDYRGRPFHPIPELMAIAEYVTKQLAICTQCGRPAHMNQRLVDSEEQLLLGAMDAYEARCRACYEWPPKSTTGLLS